MSKKVELEAFPENFRELVNTADYRKTTERRLWDIALLFLEGKQWLQYDATARTNINMAGQGGDGAGWRVTVNLLLNIYRNLLSKLATEYPSIAVTPATGLTNDIIKAQSTELALKYFWTDQKLKEKLAEAFSWLLTCGTVGMHTFYNDENKTVETEVINPYDLIFEPYVSSPEESDWIAIRRHVKKWELIKQFPKHKVLIKEASDSLQAGTRPGESSLEQVPSGRLEIFEVYWRDGKHAFLLGSEYLYKGVSPVVTNGRIPIAVLRYTEVPGKLWGVGLIAPLIDMQWLYNKSRSQVLQNIELMANPKWLIPKTSGVNPNAITNRAGEKVYYNAAGGTPTQIGAAALPGHVFDNITRLQSEMMDVSGIHSTSLGKRAVGITSGKAMQTLQDADTSQLQITQLNIEERMRDVATSAIRLMKYYYKESKMIRMMDGLGQMVFKEISNTDYVDDPEVFIETGSLFRNEAQDRDAKVLQLYEMKLLPPEEALKELSYRTGNRFVVQRMEDMAHAKELLEAATRGFMIEIFKTDNLGVFQEVWGGYMKQPEYYTLPEEIQDYIRDVYVSLSIPEGGLPPEEAAANDKVYPVASSPKMGNSEAIGSVMNQSSNQGQMQQTEEILTGRGKAADFARAEKEMARGAEALLSTKVGGMG